MAVTGVAVTEVAVTGVAVTEAHATLTSTKARTQVNAERNHVDPANIRARRYARGLRGEMGRGCCGRG